MGIRWTRKPTELDFAGYVRALEAEVQSVAQETAAALEAAARQNAPWQDQTGDARAGLHSQVVVEPGHIRIVLAHTMSYGVFLERIVRGGSSGRATPPAGWNIETEQAGTYAIIWPTIEDELPRLRRRLLALAGRRRSRRGRR